MFREVLITLLSLEKNKKEPKRNERKKENSRSGGGEGRTEKEKGEGGEPRSEGGKKIPGIKYRACTG